MNAYKELIENEKTWNQLLFNVCSGDAKAIDTLCRFEVFDFFSFVENYEKNIKSERGKSKNNS